MRVVSASEPGTPGRDNEDWVSTTSHVVAVLDGATARTETGCRHGVAWYATQLGAAVSKLAADPGVPLRVALAKAISDVARLHPGCDLTHPGTPSAAAGIIRVTPATVEYLVLGDVTVAADVDGTVVAVADDRVSRTAQAERAEADRWPIGAPEKTAAMLAMKHVELAARNRPGGYWVAETDPQAAGHALVGEWPRDRVRRVAVVTDGAARAVAFGLMTVGDMLHLLDVHGPAALVDQVRAAERSDPTGLRWPRNKASDDATVVYVKL